MKKSLLTAAVLALCLGTALAQTQPTGTTGTYQAPTYNSTNASTAQPAYNANSTSQGYNSSADPNGATMRTGTSVNQQVPATPGNPPVYSSPTGSGSNVGATNGATGTGTQNASGTGAVNTTGSGTYMSTNGTSATTGTVPPNAGSAPMSSGGNVAGSSMSGGMGAASGAGAQTQYRTPNGRTMAAHRTNLEDGVIMRGNKVLLIQNGQMMPLDHDLTLGNGSSVMADGTVRMADGSTSKLANGTAISMDGRMMKVSAMRKESRQNHSKGDTDRS